MYRYFVLGAMGICILLPDAVRSQNGAAPPEQGARVDHTALSGYILGPEDVITVHALDAEEISGHPVRIDAAGYIRLPLVRRVKAAGLTVQQLEVELTQRLKAFLTEPDVSVSITTFGSQPISVIGSVRTPGIHQLEGNKTLIEALSMAGGLTDDAGYTVQITRKLVWGRIPLPGVADDPSAQFSVAEIKLNSLLSGKHPEENITLCPHDVVAIPRAKMVYVTGEVVRSGGFVLHEQETMSVLQALALAGGVNRTASTENVRILRVSPEESSRIEIPVNLKKLLSGRAEDLAMRADDILFIPSSTPKKAAIRAVETAIQLGTGVVIWRR